MLVDFGPCPADAYVYCLSVCEAIPSATVENPDNRTCVCMCHVSLQRWHSHYYLLGFKV
jgi:hypothetical protein